MACGASRSRSLGGCIVAISFAPSGLIHFPACTHGLRRGLYSCAASRLRFGWCSLHVAPRIWLALSSATLARDAYVEGMRLWKARSDVTSGCGILGKCEQGLQF